MTRKSHWMKEKDPKPGALGVFIGNFQELGEDGLCKADDWMLEYQPGTVLDMPSRMCAKLCAMNNVLAGRHDVADKIKTTLQRYADEGDADAALAVIEIEFAARPRSRRFVGLA